MVSFLLNNQIKVIDDVAPSLSILQYLRLHLGRSGTKEGCAAGDCGACTVVIAEIVGEKITLVSSENDTLKKQSRRLAYRAINACITPVSTLQGKQLITVEDLATEHSQLESIGDDQKAYDSPIEKSLHPVQQAMVECHGSQCGFCTPGIVMSLFAWWHNVKAKITEANRESIEQALSGNLCRCTGYQPIFNAAEMSLKKNDYDHFLEQEKKIIEKLEELIPNKSSKDDGLLVDNTESQHSQSTKNGFLIPKTLNELFQFKRKYTNAQIIAGSTDLGLEFTQSLKTPSMLIYTGEVGELKSIACNSHSLSIGAAVTFSEVQSTLDKLYPEFGDLLHRFASLQIRNQATLAGNIANASPIGDTPPVVLALGGMIHVASESNKRVINADDFFISYRQTALLSDEIIESISLPLLGENEHLKVYKISKRFDDDISAICMALWIEIENNTIQNIRIGMGGMAAVPCRAYHTESALMGKNFDEDTVASAKPMLSKDFQPIDDVRASASYRIEIAGNLLTRAMLEINENSMVKVFDPKFSDDLMIMADK